MLRFSMTLRSPTALRNRSRPMHRSFDAPLERMLHERFSALLKHTVHASASQTNSSAFERRLVISGRSSHSLTSAIWPKQHPTPRGLPTTMEGLLDPLALSTTCQQFMLHT